MGEHTQQTAKRGLDATSGSGDLLSPEITMLILTWTTFIVLWVILKKFAWKPILKTLDDREQTIRNAVEEAAKTHEEFLKIGEKRRQILTEADNQAKEILNQSRQIAMKNAKIIQDRAKEESEIIMENARREIEAEQEKVAAYLREKSANAAVLLAGHILKENLDPGKHQKIIDHLIEEI